MRIPGIIAEENLTFVFGMAMNIHVNTPAVATKGRKRNMNLRIGTILSNTDANTSVELRKMDIPDVTTTNTGTNNRVIT
jgi:hypothetical protein